MTKLGFNAKNIDPEKTSISRRKPRICMLTTRNFAKNAWRCGSYEAQDILSDVDDVDLLYLKPKKAYELREFLHRDIVWHDFTKKAISINMAYHSIRLTKEYDVFIAYIPYSADLIQVSAIKGWKDHCKTSICWIDELWATNIPKMKSWLSVLKGFDHIAIGLHGTVNAASDALKQPCHWMPGAVDTFRFSPYPRPPDRVIDIYSLGRTAEQLCRAYLRLSANNKMFYIYDTFNAADAQVKDCREHREMLANMLKRSIFTLVQPAKAGENKETNNQIELGFRFFEASAAGAIMLGQTPRCESFNKLFDWPEAVIEIKPDGSDAAEVISDLISQPERLLKISRRNAKEALLRHDWVYRWEEILRIAGLEPRPELLKRKEHLNNLAQMIDV